MTELSDGGRRVAGGAQSQREQAQYAARNAIEYALAEEQEAYRDYQRARERVAAAIAHARHHEVPWGAISDALGGVTRSAAVQRLTTSRAGGAQRTHVSLAVPPGAKPPHLPTLLDEHAHHLTGAAAALWNSPRVRDAICDHIDAETTNYRTQATLAGTPPEQVIIGSWRYARSRISDAETAIATISHNGITDPTKAATTLPTTISNPT